MTNYIRYFVDTNLFIQFKDLKSVDWTAFNQYDRIDLVISRPVSRELDDKKNSTRRRLRDRSRQIIRQMIQSQEQGDEYIQINETGPDVKLYVELNLNPSNNADYYFDNTNDEQILSTAVAYKDKFGKNVGILTDDSTPLLRATNFDLEATKIPQNWRLPQETTEEQKELNLLRQQNAAFLASHPSVLVQLDLEDGDKNHVLLEPDYYAPLTDSESELLLDKLRNKYPIATEYDSESADIKPEIGLIERSRGLRIRNQNHVPVSEEMISRYVDKEYPTWVEECKFKLSKYHQYCSAQVGELTIDFKLSNNGGKPADDCLVQFTAKGDFELFVPADKDDDTDVTTELEFDLPPAPPKGRWEYETYNAFDTFSNQMLSSGNYMFREPAIPSSMDFGRLGDVSRDDNKFYYKHRRPEHPVNSFKLSCKQWRHQEGHEIFTMSLWLDQSEPVVTGEITCTVTATNLATPVNKSVQVTIKNKHLSTYAKASEAIDNT